MQRWLASRRFHTPGYHGLKDCETCLHGYQAPFRLTYFVCITLVLGVITLVINIYQLHAMPNNRALYNDIHASVVMVESQGVPRLAAKPVVWIHGKKMESGYLTHVYKVFDRLGYKFGSQASSWDVLWAHDYPFTELPSVMQNLLPHQKVNHFPGSGFITNKVSLATSNLSHVPAAFRMPYDQDKLLQFAASNANKMFVQKNNKHRGIKVEHIKDLNVSADGTFIQEFVHNPYLIDGKKFDIGIYTVLTSIDPLRVYVYDGEALLRFCPKDYHPFDPEDLDKYVVGDEYLPTWEVPSLKTYYTDLGYTMKESLNAFIYSQGKNPGRIWNQIDEAVREVYISTEHKLMAAVASKYKSSKNFFEMVRFDFLLDEDLNVYIMEANMSPNLSSAHFPPNKLIYEQVIFNLLSVVGLAHSIDSSSIEAPSDDTEAMQVSNRDIAIFAKNCASVECRSNCSLQHCKLCNMCFSQEWTAVLKTAYKEQLGRRNCRRIIPPAMSRKSSEVVTLDKLQHLSENNRLMYIWFQGKCLQHSSWCL